MMRISEDLGFNPRCDRKPLKRLSRGLRFFNILKKTIWGTLLAPKALCRPFRGSWCKPKLWRVVAWTKVFAVEMGISGQIQEPLRRKYNRTCWD